jgi:ADP-heptose:LPS heptosyltransferase
VKRAEECAFPAMDERAPRIAVLVDREGMGDVILKAPFLRALRRAFPNHEVWWIATHQSAMADQLRTMFAADVAGVITHAALDGAPGPLLKRLRALGSFDLVFDSRTKISTVAMARLGLRHRGFYCCLPGHILSDGDAVGRRPRHIAERMVSMVASATGRAPDASGRLEASAEACDDAKRELPDGRTFVAIAPSSRQPDKNWPIERFCAAATALARAGVTPVFLLGPVEPQLRGQIEAATPESIVLADQSATLPPGASLDRLIARGQRCSALLANDNGVGHLLGAAGVSVVSLFGPTDPRRWAPVAPANLILEARSFGGGRDIGAIPTEAVVQAVIGILGRGEAAQVPPAMKS